MTLIAGRYRLDREIGRGGMGTVWLAEDAVLGRLVAVKRIGTMPGATEADLDRVRRESRVSAMLSNENVVVVFDLAAEGDEHWLVMEYVESETLAQLVQRRGPLPPDEVAALAAQAATALVAAHQAGIVHRDIKPSNLLVTPSGHVKLGDFGIARIETDQGLTQTGLLIGSPGYLAPEVITGAAATTASDLWSLGATLFHAVEGHPPYDTSNNMIGALYRVVNEESPRPVHAGWLAPVVHALMDHDPAARWDAEEVVTFLVAGLRTTEPTRALPVPAADPVIPGDPGSRGTWRRLPRRAAPAIGALAALVVLVIGLAVFDVGPWADPKGPVADAADPGAASHSPSSSPSNSDSSTPSAARMQKFVEGYLATAPNDPHASFAQLTPRYQQQSGGFAGYEGFWGTVASAVPSNIRAYPNDLTVSFLAKYRLNDGKRRTDGVTLHLVFDGKRYLIDGDDSRPVRS